MQLGNGLFVEHLGVGERNYTMEMAKNMPTVDFSMTVEDVRQLAESIEFHYKNWPGAAPGREDEQQRIRRLRYMFRAALMEVSYHMDSHGE